MRYEVKIGILALIAIGSAFWGFKYIQGSNLFSDSRHYEVHYANVGGLTVGTPVQISGVTVGSVSNIFLNQAANNRVEVTLDVDDDINVPKTARAYITADGVLGGKIIMLYFSAPCLGTGDCAQEGDLLTGATMGMLASFLGGDPEADFTKDLKDQLSSVVDSLRYELFSPESENPIARSTQDLALTMENLKRTTASLELLLDRNSGQINATMGNLASLTGALADKQQAITGIIDNAENLSGDLAALELEQTVGEINTIVTQLRNTLGEADAAIGGVANVMDDVRSGKGTLGKLLTDDAIYNRLDEASRAADTLFTDLQERPYRYVPFKSRRRVLRFDRKDTQLEASGAQEFQAIEQ